MEPGPEEQFNPDQGEHPPDHQDAITSQSAHHRAGFVGIIGRPNAGKSTLFNRLLGQKLSIITHKAQTTRHRIPGFYSDDDCQIVFLDTPGIIQPSYLLQERMMEKVVRLRNDADLLLHLVDATKPPDSNDVVWETLKELRLPVILVVNKIDLHEETGSGSEADRSLDSMEDSGSASTSPPDSGKSGRIDEWIRHCQQFFTYDDVVAVSALHGYGLPELIGKIRVRLPVGPPFYPKDQASDLAVRFFVSELIREQLYLIYHQEIPYSCAVNIVDYQEGEKMDRISAEIVVNRNSQKGILIGRKGAVLKQLGIRSRQEIEQFIGKRIHLDLFVKVREKWRDNDQFLKSYGYR